MAEPPRPRRRRRRDRRAARGARRRGHARRHLRRRARPPRLRARGRGRGRRRLPGRGSTSISSWRGRSLGGGPRGRGRVAQAFTVAKGTRGARCSARNPPVVIALVAERGVSEACRLMGVHRSTYYRWKGQVQRSGLEMLRPRERAAAADAQPALRDAVEQRIVAFALGQPGLGFAGSPRAWRARSGVACRSAPTGSTRRCAAWSEHARQALGRWSRATGRRSRCCARPRPNRTSTATIRASWSGSTASSSASVAHRRQGPGLADPPRSTNLLKLCLGRPGRLPTPQARPRRVTTSALARRALAAEPPGRGSASSSPRALRQRQRVRPPSLRQLRSPPASATPRSRSGRPQTNGHVEPDLHRTIPRRMLATRLRPLPPSPLHRPTPRPRPLPARLQPRPRTPPTQDGRVRCPADLALRCPQDGAPR